MDLPKGSSPKSALNSVGEDGVCEICRRIDFKKVLDLDAKAFRHMEEVRIQIADFGSLFLRDTITSCAICRMFADATIPSPGRPERTCELRAYSMLRDSPHIQWWKCLLDLRNQDQPFLAVVEQGMGNEPTDHLERVGQIFCRDMGDVRTRLFSPQRVLPHIECSSIRRWLGYCNAHHKKLCSVSRIRRESLDLKVIDCLSISVIAAPPSCRYTALSYVWNHSQEILDEEPGTSKVQSLVSFSSLPQTVKDAITITQRLGLQYLWVDKICIDQKNEAEKRNQMSQMDSIYNRAEITLIAAAGSDENFGLPGVDAVARNPQSTAIVGNIELICTMRHPFLSIRHSKWYTRGWTLQEAVLSRRRLVFTEHQLYFECNAMNCCESLSADLNALHTKRKDKSLLMMHNGVLSGTGGVRDGFSPTDGYNLSMENSLARYYHLIENYTARDLTFDGDSFNAFAGIARSIAHSRFPIFHVSGLPIPALTSLERYKDPWNGEISAVQSGFLASSLVWIHTRITMMV